MILIVVPILVSRMEVKSIDVPPTGGVISISTDQPCVETSQQTTTRGASTVGMDCNKATIVVLGLTPGPENEVDSPFVFEFISLPESDGAGSVQFSGSGDQTGDEASNFCDDPTGTGSQSCVLGLPGADPVTVEVFVSKMIARYQLKETGITVPYSYLYNTGLYQYWEGRASWSQCQVSTESQVSISCDDATKQFSGSDAIDMFADIYVTNYGLAPPGSVNSIPGGPTAQQSAGGTLLNGEFSRDVIYTKWFNGTLGCGGSVQYGIDMVETSNGVMNTQTSPSNPPCTYEGGSSSIINPADTLRPTRPVCPGNPLTCWKARNGNLLATQCLSGSCAGVEDGLCPLVTGFGYGGSRCASSRETAIAGVNAFVDVCPDLAPAGCDSSGSGTTSKFSCDRYMDDTNCFILNQQTASEASLPAITALLPCFCTMCNYMNGDLSTPNPSPIYPSDICPNNVQTMCQYSYPGGGIPLTQQLDDDCSLDKPPPYCAGSDDDDDTSSAYNGGDGIQLKDLKCSCGCASQWYDTVIPVGPLCDVYEISNPAVPMFNVTVVLTNSTGAQQTLVVGTAANETTDGFVPFALSSDGSFRIDLTNIDQPRGQTMPIQPGFIVVCGNRLDNTQPARQDFIGSSDALGLVNPFTQMNNQVPQTGSSTGRMPLPSTYLQFQETGVIPDIIKTSPGNVPAWWYFVPPEKTIQYGDRCNQNGWLNYGTYDYSSATEMCAGRQGTCVPGYDLRGGTSQSQEDPIRFPTVNTPCNVARQFVNFETGGGANMAQGKPLNSPTSSGSTVIDVPDFLPIGWDPFNPNFWVHRDGLFSDTKNGNPAYVSGDVFVRLSLAIAGILVSDSVSVSGGYLEYIDGTRPPAEDPLNAQYTPLGSCVLSLTSFSGKLSVKIVNSGSLPGTYSLTANCTNSATVDTAPTNVAVSAGAASEFSLGILIEGTLDSSPECVVSLLPADLDTYPLSSIPVLCSLTENIQMGVGGYVTSQGVGNVTQNQADPNPPVSAACRAFPWACDPIGGFNPSGKFLTVVVFFGIMVLSVVLIITVVSVLIGYANRSSDRQQIQSRSMRDGLRVSVAELRAEKSPVATLSQTLEMIS
jgi:hypothetical protein